MAWSMTFANGAKNAIPVSPPRVIDTHGHHWWNAYLPTARFCSLHVDLVGSLPASRGMTNLCTTTDRFTWRAEAILYFSSRCPCLYVCHCSCTSPDCQVWCSWEHYLWLRKAVHLNALIWVQQTFRHSSSHNHSLLSTGKWHGWTIPSSTEGSTQDMYYHPWLFSCWTYLWLNSSFTMEPDSMFVYHCHPLQRPYDCPYRTNDKFYTLDMKGRVEVSLDRLKAAFVTPLTTSERKTVASPGIDVSPTSPNILCRTIHRTTIISCQRPSSSSNTFTMIQNTIKISTALISVFVIFKTVKHFAT